MKIATWNINGLKSAISSGFTEWLASEKPDILCLQETKFQPDMFTADWFHGYHFEIFPADKKGYSGVGILVSNKYKDIRFTKGVENKKIDDEGRVISLILPNIDVINIYAPHSHRELKNLNKKKYFCDYILSYLRKRSESSKPFIVAGDLNVAHQERDLTNFKQNVGNAGFHELERSWFSDMLSIGLIDCFRIFQKESGHYTWWSLLPTVRERNVGWRLDYILASQSLESNIVDCLIKPEVRGSDHCPVVMELSNF